MAQNPKPQAVFAIIGAPAVPEIETQIMAESLRSSLSPIFNLEKQGAFEKMLHKNAMLNQQKKCGMGCILKANQQLSPIHLFVFQKSTEGQLRLKMLDANGILRQRTANCENIFDDRFCDSSFEHTITHLIRSLEPFFSYPDKSSVVVEKTEQKKAALSEAVTEKPKTKKDDAKISSAKTPEKKAQPTETKTQSKAKTESSTITEKKVNIAEPKPLKKPEPKIDPEVRKMRALEQLQFKLAERRYNSLIWSEIKKELMFFRQTQKAGTEKPEPARLRLHIDRFGRIVGHRLIRPSNSEAFNQTIQKMIRNIRLPEPMAILVKYPPYVVNILLLP